MIPRDFQPKEGTKLTDDLIVSKHISSGLQGGVYDLQNLDGNKANMVFKVCYCPYCADSTRLFFQIDFPLNFNSLNKTQGKWTDAPFLLSSL